VPGTEAEFNQSLERANRVVDYLELAELMCLDALHRSESCGGHFREESQTPDGEAARKDEESPTPPRGSSPPAPGARPAQGRPGLRPRTPHPAELRMRLTLRVWRQQNTAASGAMRTYRSRRLTDMSFLECSTPSTNG